MEYITSGKKEFVVDLESGGNGCPGDISSGHNPVVANDKQGNRILNKLAGGILRYNISASSGSDSDTDSHLDKPRRYSLDDIKLMIDENAERRHQEEQVPLLEKELSQGKPQSTNSKNASKPPRPPKGPSLDASDQMLVKEISELVKKKRARKERIKAFNRLKAAKPAPAPSSPSPSSFKSTVCALLVTVAFLLIIIFQGIAWRNSSNSILHGSPGPTTGSDGLISVQVFSNPLPNHGIAPSSESPSSVEQNLGSGLISPG